MDKYSSYKIWWQKFKFLFPRAHHQNLEYCWRIVELFMNWQWKYVKKSLEVANYCSGDKCAVETTKINALAYFYRHSLNFTHKFNVKHITEMKRVHKYCWIYTYSGIWIDDYSVPQIEINTQFVFMLTNCTLPLL